MKRKKLFTFIQLFLLLGAGFFSLSTLTQSANASDCNIFADNGGLTWDCTNVKTRMTIDNLTVNADGSQAPTTLQVGQSYTFHSTVTIKNELQSNDYGISFAQIQQSPTGTAIDTTGPNAANLTIGDLSQNRAASNDLQQAVDNHGNNIGAGQSWDTYQCSGSIVHYDINNGKTVALTCTFTPSKTGYFQVDTNSKHFNATSTSNCVQGLCGPIAAIFIKVIPAPQLSLVCTDLKVTDQATGQPYDTSNNQPISVSISPLKDGSGNPTNQQRTMVATITGNSNQSPLGIKWRVRGAEGFNGTVWNEDSANITTLNTDNGGNFSNSYQFTFGPFSDMNGSNSNIQALDHYSFSVLPILYVVDNGQFKQYNTESLGACNAGLTTQAAPSVLPGTTTAEITVNKSLVTAEPIPVGQTATFKVTLTNTGKDQLITVNFHDLFQDNNIMDFVSANGFETVGGVNSATKDLGLVASNGTTSTIDLTALFGKPLNTGDSFTLMLTFLGKGAGSNIDTAIGCAVSAGGSKPCGSSQASVIFSPPPTAPNTGAETPVTAAAIFLFIVGVAGKKYVLKSLLF